jgi:hypothetical protein
MKSWLPVLVVAPLLALLAGPSSGEPAAAQSAAQPATPAPLPAPGSIRPQPIGTMADLMGRVIYPASDAIIYIETRTPENEAQWNELVGKAIIVAESANILMLPAHMRDQQQWMADAKLMRDAGEAALVAAKKRDVKALIDLNEALVGSCQTCHRHYRRGYGRGAQPTTR